MVYQSTPPFFLHNFAAIYHRISHSTTLFLPCVPWWSYHVLPITPLGFTQSSAWAPRYHRPHLGHGPVQQDLWWPPAVVLRNSPPGPRAPVIAVIAQWALASIFISTWVEAPDDVVFSPPQGCFLNPFPRKQWSHSWIAYQLRTSPDLTCRKWSTLGFYTHQPATQAVSAPVTAGAWHPFLRNFWSFAELPLPAPAARDLGRWPHSATPPASALGPRFWVAGCLLFLETRSDPIFGDLNSKVMDFIA